MWSMNMKPKTSLRGELVQVRDYGAKFTRRASTLSFGNLTLEQYRGHTLSTHLVPRVQVRNGCRPTSGSRPKTKSIKVYSKTIFRKTSLFRSLPSLSWGLSKISTGHERLRKCKLQSHLEALLSGNSDCIVLSRESESELSAWQNLEEEFLKRTNDWKPNFMEGFPKIPVRTETGDIGTLQLSKEWQGWHDVLPQMGILDTTSKHGGKPVRHLNISLRSPILIKPLKGRHEAMISKRFSMTPDKFFQVLIDAIHNTSDPDSPGPIHYPWKLQIHPEQKQEGYIMVGS